jgi:putative heme-binding domain-containing protein
MPRSPALMALALLVASSSARAQEPELVAKTEARTPDEERKAFHLPPGFEAQLVADEPAINKPMNLAFDDRGRLWVTTTVEYPYPAKEGTKARDRVVILDDFAPDGRAHKVTTFADGLNIPIGVLPLGRGDSALVHSIPAIRRWTDTDGDGKADKSEEMYSSYGFKDTHGMTNAFTWGFDGWIYACHGFSNESTVKGKDGQPIVMQSGNTYRMKPDGSHLEYYTHGQVNPFGLAFDPLGNLYSCDCHSRPIYCLLPGAHYPSFGKPDDGLGFGPEMVTHDHGSTGIGGIAFYAAEHFPKAYQDTIFIGNVVTSRINHDKLEWTGSSPKGIAQPDFLVSDDPWFRPVDLELGPDGALYIADFYNRIIGHYEVPLTHPGRDRERGRIWRIVYKGDDRTSKPLRPGYDGTKESVDGLVKDLGDANLVRRMHAANMLVEKGQGVAEAVKKAAREPAPAAQRAQALWVLDRLDRLDLATLALAAHDRDEMVRVHAMRIVGDRASGRGPEAELARTALSDESPMVRRAAAEAIGKYAPTADALKFTENVRALLDLVRGVRGGDEHLKHSARIGLRDELAPAKDWEKRLVGELSDSDRRAIADVAPGVHNAEAAAFLASHLKQVKESPENRVRYLRHVARFGRETDQEAIASIVKSESDLGKRVALINAVQEGEQSRGATWPKGVLEVADATARVLIESNDAGQFKLGVGLIGDARLAQFREPLAKIAADRSAAESRREPAMAALAEIDSAAAIQPIGKVISESTEPMPLREQAVKLLAAMGQPGAMDTLVAALPTVPGSLQTSIASGLVRSPGGAERLLKAIEAGKASARLLQERGVAVPIAAFNLKTLNDRVGPLLKGLPPAEARIQEIIGKRRESFGKASTDLARGASVFEKSCAACHQLGGKGARIGPQLDGVGVRGPDRLLEDILDPNRNVDQAFRVTSLNLKDGRVVSGLLLREEGETLVLADAQGKEVRVARGDVEDRAVSQLSPMPANWADQIPEPEFADLLAYLLAQRPNDEPARKP